VGCGGTVETKLGDRWRWNICKRFWGKNKFAGRDIENKGIDMDCAICSCLFEIIGGRTN
jgi:hypothetical protein